METRIFEVMIGSHIVGYETLPDSWSAKKARSGLLAKYGDKISVYKLAPTECRIEDCARATHPEEL